MTRTKRFHTILAAAFSVAVAGFAHADVVPMSPLRDRGVTVRRATGFGAYAESAVRADGAAPAPFPLAPIAMLQSPTPAEFRLYGQSVALSTSGMIAIVGAPDERVDGIFRAGAAHVFRRVDGHWLHSQRLTAPAPAVEYGEFGFSVAVSADENTLTIGAPNIANAPGRAYVFVRSGTTWLLADTLTGTSMSYDDFGVDVAIDAGGSRIIVGAWAEKAGNELVHGAAYVFAREGAQWTREATLDGAGLSLEAGRGRCVAITADGSKTIVGAPYAHVGSASQVGALHAFTRAGTTWSPQPPVFPSDGGSMDWFGWDCSLSADGTRALVGSPDGHSADGQAYAYDTTTWQESRIESPVTPTEDDMFGVSVDLSDDGRIAVIGAPYVNNFRGSAYVFENAGADWTVIDTLHGRPDDHGFGVPVAWSDARGGEVLVGTTHSRDDGSEIYGVYVFGDEHIFGDTFGD